MSIARTVAALIDERGHGTANDILPDMEGYTRAQVVTGLQNAAYEGMIACDGRGPRSGKRGGSLPATYRAIKKTYRPVSSVWALAGASLTQG